MIRRPPRSTRKESSAASDVYKRQDTDPGSGLKRVYATVMAQVYQDDGLFFETVASVKPTQFAGLGPNETVAETNALIKAAESASNEIVQQLNAAGIR